MTLDTTTTALPRIAGARLVLRPLRREDAGPVGLYASDRRVAFMTSSIPHPYPPGAAEAFVERVSAPDAMQAVWGIDIGSAAALEAGGLIGLVSLSRLDRAQAEIGYWVAPAFWNAGYASEAVSAIVAANPLGNKALFATVFQDNPGSARVLTNAGFTYLGDAEMFCVSRGATMPTWTYSRKLG